MNPAHINEAYARTAVFKTRIRFTRVTARRIARSPKATFVTRLSICSVAGEQITRQTARQERYNSGNVGGPGLESGVASPSAR